MQPSESPPAGYLKEWSLKALLHMLQFSDPEAMFIFYIRSDHAVLAASCIH